MSRIRGTRAEISDKKRQFGLWLGLPDSVRDPKTQAELATRLGVLNTTLSHWKEDPDVKDAKNSALKVLGGNDMYDITKTIVSKAKEGNFQMARLYMEWQGEVGGKQANKAQPVELVLSYGTKKDRDSD